MAEVMTPNGLVVGLIVKPVETEKVEAPEKPKRGRTVKKEA